MEACPGWMGMEVVVFWVFCGVLMEVMLDGYGADGNLVEIDTMGWLCWCGRRLM